MARRDEDSAAGGTALLDAPATNGTEDMQMGTGTGTGTGAGAGKPKRAKRNPDELPDDEAVGVNVRLPNALRKLIAADGLKQSPQVSVPQLVTQMLANAYNFELPVSTRPARIKKYASKEERVEAQKAQQRRQRNITKAVLQLVEQGKLGDIDIEALVSQIEAEQNAATAGGATEGAAS